MKNCQKALLILAAFFVLNSCAPAAADFVVPVPTSTPAVAATIAPTPTPQTPTLTLAATQTFTSTPTPKPTPTVTPTKARPGLVDSVIDALFKESKRLRDLWKDKDLRRTNRIDWPLNEGRFNILLIGYGETYEPPVTIQSGAVIASFSLISYSVATGEVTIFSFTHDIRAPEVERVLNSTPAGKGTAKRMGKAYLESGVGGFALSREVVEDATGLAVDFVIAFDDSILRDVVDKILGGVEIEVRETFEVHGFRLGNKLYDKIGRFEKGVQTLDGIKVIQYIKTVPVASGAYPKELEHNVRKHQVFAAILLKLGTKCGSKFWVDSGWTLVGMVNDRRVKADFDLASMLTSNLNSIPGIVENLLRGECRGVSLPGIKSTKYIVDPAHGDGGVQWITANAAVNSLTAKDIALGVYQGLDFEIPAGGEIGKEFMANPYGDLPTEYWGPVRTLVKESLR